MRMKGANEVFEEGTVAVARAQKAFDDYKASQEATIASSRNYSTALQELTNRKLQLTSATKDLAAAEAEVNRLQALPPSSATATQLTRAQQDVSYYRTQKQQLSENRTLASNIGPAQGSIQESHEALAGKGVFDPQTLTYASNFNNKLQEAILTENELKISTEKLGPAGQKAFEEMGTAAEGWKAVAVPLLEVGAGIVAVTALIGVKAAVMAAEFKESLAQALSASELLGVDGVANLKLYNDKLLELGDAGPFGAMKLASALESVASAGYHGAAAMGVLAAAQEGAIAIGQKDITSYANALMNLMDNFDTGANQIKVSPFAGMDEQINQYQEQVTEKYTNMFDATVIGSRASASEISQIVGYSGPAAEDVGITPEELLASIGALSNTGGTPKRMGPQLQMIMQNLMNPTAQGGEVLQAVGVTPGINAVSNAGGLEALLSKISQGITGQKGNTTFQNADPAVMAEVFGQKAVDVIRRLEQVSPERQSNGTYGTFLQDELKKINNSGNTVSTGVALVESTTKAHWDDAVKTMGDGMIRLGENFQEAATVLVDTVLPTITVFIAGINDVVQVLSLLFDAVSSILSAIGAIKDAINSVEALSDAFKSLIDGIGVMTVLIALMKISNNSIGAFNAIVNAALLPIDAFGASTAQVAATLDGVAVATVETAVAMNPLVAVAIGLAGAFTLAATNSSFLSDAFSTAGSRIEALLVKLNLMDDPNKNKLGPDDKWLEDLLGGGSNYTAQTRIPSKPEIPLPFTPPQVTPPTNYGLPFPFKPTQPEEPNPSSRYGVSLPFGNVPRPPTPSTSSSDTIKGYDISRPNANPQYANNPAYNTTEHVDGIMDKALKALHEMSDLVNNKINWDPNKYKADKDYVTKIQLELNRNLANTISAQNITNTGGADAGFKANTVPFDKMDDLIKNGDTYLTDALNKRLAPLFDRLKKNQASNADISLATALENSPLQNLVPSSFGKDKYGSNISFDEIIAQNRLHQSTGTLSEKQMADNLALQQNISFQANKATAPRVAAEKTTLQDMMSTGQDPTAVREQMKRVLADTVNRSITLDKGALRGPEHQAAEDQLLTTQQDYADKFTQQHYQTIIQNLQREGASAAAVHGAYEGMYNTEIAYLQKRDSYGRLLNEAGLKAMEAQKALYDKQYAFSQDSKSLGVAQQNAGQTEYKSFASQRADANLVLHDTLRADKHDPNLTSKDDRQLADDKARIAARQAIDKINQDAAQTALQAAQDQYQNAQDMGAGTNELRARWAVVMKLQEDLIKSEKLGPEKLAQANAALHQQDVSTNRGFNLADINIQQTLAQATVDLANATKGNYPAQIEALRKLHDINVQLIEKQDQGNKAKTQADLAKESASYISSQLGVSTQQSQTASTKVGLEMSAAQFNGANVAQITSLANKQYLADVNTAFKSGLKGDELSNAIAQATQKRDNTTTNAQATQYGAQADFFSAQAEVIKSSGGSLQAQLVAIENSFKKQEQALAATKGLTPDQRRAKEEGLTSAEAQAINPLKQGIASEANDAAKNLLDAAKANGASVEQQKILFENFIDTQRALIYASVKDPKDRANALAALGTASSSGVNQLLVVGLTENSNIAKAQLDSLKAQGASLSVQQTQAEQYYQDQRQAIIQNTSLDDKTKQADLLNLAVQNMQTQQQFVTSAATDNANSAKAQLDASKQFGASVQVQRALTDASFNSQREQILANRTLSPTEQSTQLASLFTQRVAADQALINQETQNNVTASQTNLDAAKLNGQSVAEQRSANALLIAAQRQALLDDKSLSTVDRQNKLASLANTGVSTDQALVAQANADNVSAAQLFAESVKDFGGNSKQLIQAQNELTTQQLAQIANNRGLTGQERTTAIQKALLDQQMFVAQVTINAANDQVSAAQALQESAKTLGLSFQDQRVLAQNLAQKQLDAINTQIGMSTQARATAREGVGNTLRGTDLDILKQQMALQVTAIQQNVDVLKANSGTLQAQSDIVLELVSVQRQQVLADTSINADQKNSALRGIDVQAYSGLMSNLQAAYTQEIGIAEENLQVNRSVGASSAQQVQAIMQLSALQMRDATRRNDPTAYNQALISQLQNVQGVINEQSRRQETAVSSLADYAKATGATPEAQEQLRLQGIGMQYEAAIQQLQAAQAMLNSSTLMSGNVDISRIASDIQKLAAQMQTSAAHDQVTAAGLQAQAATLLSQSAREFNDFIKPSYVNVDATKGTTGKGVTEKVDTLANRLVVTLPPDQIVSFTTDTTSFHTSTGLFGDYVKQLLGSRTTTDTQKQAFQESVTNFGTHVNTMYTAAISMSTAIAQFSASVVKASETAVATNNVAAKAQAPFVGSETNNMPSGSPYATVGSEQAAEYQRQLNQRMTTAQITVPTLNNPAYRQPDGAVPVKSDQIGPQYTGAAAAPATDSWDLLMQKMSSGLVDVTAAVTQAQQIKDQYQTQLSSGQLLSATDEARLTSAMQVLQQGVQTRTDRANIDVGQSNLALTLAQQLAPNQFALDQQTAATNTLVSSLEKLASISGDLNGSIAQQIAQAKFAQSQRQAQFDEKQFGDLETFAQNTHASIATMQNLIDKQAQYELANQAQLGLNPLEIYNKEFAAKQQLLQQQFSSNPLNFGQLLQSAAVPTAGLGQTVASFGLSAGTTTANQIATNTAQTNENLVKVVTGLASILSTLQQQQLNIQRSADQQINLALPNSVHNTSTYGTFKLPGQ